MVWRNPHFKTGAGQPKVFGNVPPLDVKGIDSGTDEVLIVVGQELLCVPLSIVLLFIKNLDLFMSVMAVLHRRH